MKIDHFLSGLIMDHFISKVDQSPKPHLIG